MDKVTSFRILKKEIYSDHCPNSLTYEVKAECSMNFINQCAMNVFNDNHLDINKRKLTPLKMEMIEWSKALKELEERADLIQSRINEGVSNEQLNALITSSIYGICKKNYKQNKQSRSRTRWIMN